jgi:hypothetical protein
MKIRIDEAIYYVNKSKFKKLYKELGLSWIEFKNINGKLVDGWFNNDSSSYLLKINAPKGIKKFESVNCKEMEDFLLSIGGINEEEIEIPKNEVDVIPSYKENPSGTWNKDFIGADISHHYRVEEILKDMPDYWEGITWNNKTLDKHEIRKVTWKRIIKRKDLV